MVSEREKAGTVPKVQNIQMGKEVMTRSSKNHGMCETLVYKAWKGMKYRCLNPKSQYFGNYGGRGITVCDEWLTFDNFFRDMGHLPFSGAQVDRKNNNKGYSKDNCVWSTRVVNCRNTRRNKNITIGQETKTLAEWSVIYNIPRETISSRIRRGVREDLAVTTPSRPRAF